MNDEYPDVMLDIETLSTFKDAVVVSIGAVRFRLDTSDDASTIKDELRNFYAVLDTAEQIEDGRATDEATLKWWGEQSDEAREVLSEEGESTRAVLGRLADFCRGCKRVWGNGNTFDNVIIRDLYEQYGQDYPVKYSGDLDVRTLRYLWNKLTSWVHKDEPRFTMGDKHNALDDARSQVIQVQKMYRELKGTRYGS